MTIDPASPESIAVAALVAYVEWHGAIHDYGCPCDDTCDCSGEWINDGITVAVNILRSSLTASERQDCLRSVEMRLGGTEGAEYQRLQALVQKLGRASA